MMSHQKGQRNDPLQMLLFEPQYTHLHNNHLRLVHCHKLTNSVHKKSLSVVKTQERMGI